MKETNSSLFLISMVAIVAIAGLIFLFSGQNNSPLMSVTNAEGDLTGMASATCNIQELLPNKEVKIRLKQDKEIIFKIGKKLYYFTAVPGEINEETGQQPTKLIAKEGDLLLEEEFFGEVGDMEGIDLDGDGSLLKDSLNIGYLSLNDNKYLFKWEWKSYVPAIQEFSPSSEVNLLAGEEKTIVIKNGKTTALKLGENAPNPRLMAHVLSNGKVDLSVSWIYANGGGGYALWGMTKNKPQEIDSNGEGDGKKDLAITYLSLSEDMQSVTVKLKWSGEE